MAAPLPPSQRKEGAMSRTSIPPSLALRKLVCAGILAVTLVPAAALAQVTPDTNPRYLRINGTPKVLIGMSSEFLPHNLRTLHNSEYCTFSNYTTCIDRLADYGLNKMQLWVMMQTSVALKDLNQSVGDTNCPASTSLNVAGWTNDQPFFWRPGDQRWNLDRPNPDFFTRLNAVLSYAAQPSKNVIVEVVLFEPGSDSYCLSPWRTGMNVATNDGSINVQFSERKLFTAFDNNSYNAADCTQSDSSVGNRKARGRQFTALKWLVEGLNGHTNFYWQLASEPDESPVGSTTLSTTALLNWHKCAAAKIVEYEGPLPNKHLIGANVWTDTALNGLANVSNIPNIKISNGHYSRILCNGTCPGNHPGKTFVGAIPTLNDYFSTLPTFAFGFNETKSTPDPSVASARAEAWEFLVGEGAIYDNYNLNRSDSRTTKVLGYLNYLRQFLAPFNLTSFGRSPGTAIPGYVTSGLPAYPLPTQHSGLDGPGLGNTYWSAMQWTRNQYALYLHHSITPDPTGPQFKSYAPCYKAAGYTNTFQFALGTLPGWYYVEWFAPGEAAPGSTIAPLCTNNINWPGSGQTAALTSPKYPYDLAVRIQRCPNGVGPCKVETSCAGLPVPSLPPHDTRSPVACSTGS
jgi:hypothetical protein